MHFHMLVACQWLTQSIFSGGSAQKNSITTFEIPSVAAVQLMAVSLTKLSKLLIVITKFFSANPLENNYKVM